MASDLDVPKVSRFFVSSISSSQGYSNNSTRDPNIPGAPSAHGGFGKSVKKNLRIDVQHVPTLQAKRAVESLRSLNQLGPIGCWIITGTPPRTELRASQTLLYSAPKNVLFPSNMRSLAPNLVNILSTAVNLQLSAGTQHPICAKITAMHVCLNNVLLPPMLGPVTSSSVCPMLGSISVSLGTKFLLEDERVTQGWRSWRRSRREWPWFWASVRNMGRHICNYTKYLVWYFLHIVPTCQPETIASDARQSNSVSRFKAEFHSSFLSQNFLNNEHKKGESASCSVSSAVSSLSMSLLSSLVWKRQYPLRWLVNSKSWGFFLPSTQSEGISSSQRYLAWDQLMRRVSLNCCLV